MVMRRRFAARRIVHQDGDHALSFSVRDCVIEDVLASEVEGRRLDGWRFHGLRILRKHGGNPYAVIASATLKPDRITLLIANMVIYSSGSDFTALRLIGYRAVDR